MALSPNDERLLWALEHACKHKTLPLDAKLEVARFVASVAPRALDAARARASGPLALLRCAVHTNGFTTLTATAANACADDLLAFARSSEAGASLSARAREIAERARCEYAFGQLRTGKDGFGASPSTRERSTSPSGSNQQWRLVENFWMRWNDIRADAMFAEDGKKLVGSKAREAYLFVEGARKQGGKLPGTWESVAADPMDILDAMGELCEDAVSTFGDSFLNGIAEDVRAGVYQVKIVNGLIEDSGRVTDASVDEAVRRSTNSREKLSSAATKSIESSGDMFSSPPKRVHIAAERKANARTVEWDSQMEQDPSPEPLATLPWDENVSQRTPRKTVSSPATGTPRKRLKWSEDEVQALRQGIEKYGAGKWQYILKDPVLFSSFHAQRTSVDLKDKWRVLSKSTA